MSAQTSCPASRMMRFTARLLACASWLLAWTAPQTHAAAALAQAEFSFLFEDNRVYVPVCAGSAPAHWFILDTGATGTILDTAFARELGLAAAGDTLVSGAGGGQTRQQHAGPVALRIADIAFDADDVHVAALGDLLSPTSGREPAGIIGAAFFRAHVVSIDFQRQRIAVFAPGTDLSHEFAASVPLRLRGELPFADVTLELPDRRTLTANALVDLGAKSTLLVPEPYIEREHLRAAFPVSVTSGLGAGMGGDTRYAFARARRVGLAARGELAVAEPIISLSVGGTLTSRWHEGLLGAEYLARFRIAFDYAQARLLLDPVPAAAPQFDMSGLFLAAAGTALDTIVVRDVRARTPAQRAGARAGDEIVSVDGAAAHTLGLAKVRALLKSAAQRIVTLRVRRGTREFDMPLKLKKLL